MKFLFGIVLMLSLVACDGATTPPVGTTTEPQSCVQTNTYTAGDTVGVENGVECIVDASTPIIVVTPSCVQPNTYSQNDTVGFEDGQVCVVNDNTPRIVIIPTCSQQNTYSPGDTSGFENGMACVVGDTTPLIVVVPDCVQENTYFEGDISGVENGINCAVKSTTPLTPICAFRKSDPDGDGWGWEEERSCFINDTSVASCITAGSDPDGDGWGWENEQSCIVDENTPSSGANGGLHVSGRYLLDGNGQQVILRGPEMVHRWGVYSGITSLGIDVAWEGGKNNNVGVTQIREIAKSGANAMRILGGIGNELDSLLYEAIVNQKMYVAVARVDWTNPEMKAVLQKYAKYIILHPRGEFTHQDQQLWRSEARNAIKVIRDLGYTSPIEMGPTGYGQNWDTLHRYGQEISESDPLRNTLFLLQLYSEYANRIPQTMSEIVNSPFPVIVDSCLFTSPYGNTPNTYKEVWDQSYDNGLSSFYWDWWGDGEGSSMTRNGYIDNLTDVGAYIIHNSPAALKNTVKNQFILNANVQ